MVDLPDEGPVPPSVLTEMMLDAIEEFTPVVEVIEPGACLVQTLGPARYHGGEEALAYQMHRGVVRALGTADGPPPLVVVVVAGGPEISILIARGAMGAPGAGGMVLVLDDGSDVEHLAARPIGHVAHLLDPGTVDLFLRLGLMTVGAFAGLPITEVRSRFGPEVAEVHRIVNGAEREPSKPTAPPVDMAVTRSMEPPLGTIDQIAFLARSMAHEVMERLTSRSLGADTVRIAFETDTGKRVERLWRVDRGLSVPVITQRVRWQAEGWLRAGRSRSRSGLPGHDVPHGRGDPTPHSDMGAVSLLHIEPGDLRPYRGVQTGFWGETDDHDRLVMGGVDRLRGLFGMGAVRVPRLRGGRSPHQSHRLVDVDDDRRPAGDDPSGPPGAYRSDPGSSHRHAVGDRTVGGQDATGPWPGTIPDPFPTRVWADPIPAEVVDGNGRPVGVSGRGVISSTPEMLSVEGGPWQRIARWAGPWCVDERWWDPVGHRRKARIQVLVEPMGTQVPQQAHLLTLEVGEWWVEATYD